MQTGLLSLVEGVFENCSGVGLFFSHLDGVHCFRRYEELWRVVLVLYWRWRGREGFVVWWGRGGDVQEVERGV